MHAPVAKWAPWPALPAGHVGGVNTVTGVVKSLVDLPVFQM